MITDIKRALAEAQADTEFRMLRIPIDWLDSLVEYYEAAEDCVMEAGPTHWRRYEAARKKLEGK